MAETKEVIKIAKETTDKVAEKVYADQAILILELRTLRDRVLSVPDGKDSQHFNLDEMRKDVDARLTKAQEARSARLLKIDKVTLVFIIRNTQCAGKNNPLPMYIAGVTKLENSLSCLSNGTINQMWNVLVRRSLEAETAIRAAKQDIKIAKDALDELGHYKKKVAREKYIVCQEKDENKKIKDFIKRTGLDLHRKANFRRGAISVISHDTISLEEDIDNRASPNSPAHSVKCQTPKDVNDVATCTLDQDWELLDKDLNVKDDWELVEQV